MFNKKTKELENRIVELENYINNLKKKDWQKEYPNGKLVRDMYKFAYKYNYNERAIPLSLKRDDISVCDAKVLKTTHINENLMEIIIRYEYYKVPNIIPYNYYGTRAHIAKYLVDKENKTAIKVKDVEECGTAYRYFGLK